LPENEPETNPKPEEGSPGTGQQGGGETPPASSTSRENEGGSGPDDEIARLKDEAASRRVAAKEATERAEKYRQQVLDYTVKEASAGLLEDHEDAFNAGNPDEDWADDDDPDAFDVDKIRASIEAMLERKPHLKARAKPRGDAGQGVRPDQPTNPMETFARALKDAAS
jgi:hypothetical protein